MTTQTVTIVSANDTDDSLGFVLPDSELARLQLKAGDSLYLTSDAGMMMLSKFAPRVTV